MSTGRERPRVGELRPSQILTTFGIGSIVDLPHISVMVMGLEDWPNSDYREITEPPPSPPFPSLFSFFFFFLCARCLLFLFCSVWVFLLVPRCVGGGFSPAVRRACGVVPLRAVGGACGAVFLSRGLFGWLRRTSACVPAVVFFLLVSGVGCRSLCLLGLMVSPFWCARVALLHSSISLRVRLLPWLSFLSLLVFGGRRRSGYTLRCAPSPARLPPSQTYPKISTDPLSPCFRFSFSLSLFRWPCPPLALRSVSAGVAYVL